LAYLHAEVGMATSGFAISNCFGQEGFGKVYHATLRSSEVIVRVLKMVWPIL